MKSIRKDAYDVKTWQQVSSKIKNAEAERLRENQSFMTKLKANTRDNNSSTAK